ncbi:MAG: 4-hydroxy-tetrahydrodipicolinate synthase [Crocinitomicaceae bacterium]|jgi:4-hydroxy-tetrahydrodipicolinate synthase|nr:4-hydroxy-tetrahydrodipicolinate synthase [Crocinitomicaceae bacterium]MBT6514939.1 4-hydroxy-tetrahydrodipicolinate synthase [Crocinitomicaceae bacterium]
MSKFKGLGVALVTPFSENGNIDYAGLQRLIELQLNGGTDYLVVHGTTGESVTLSADEKKASLEFIQEINNGKLPVVIGIGGNNTREVCAQLEAANLSNVDGVLSVSPAYNKPTQNGIYAHFHAVANATDKDIILYNVPGRTGSNVTAETTVRCAEDFANIVAVKEASGNLEQTMQIIKNRPEGFSVLSGDDALALPVIASGGDGLISVIGNAFPGIYAEMIHAAIEGRLADARIHHYQVFDLIHWLFADGNPGGIKEVLKYMNVCHNHVRLPLVPVGKLVSDKLYALLAESELVMT